MAENTIIYDSIIIGAGPAGMTAALYLGRANNTVAIIDKDGFGGNIARSPRVENIPGFMSISGIDFASNMYEQIMALNTVQHIIGEVVLVQYKRGLFIVSLNNKEIYMGKTVIFATGSKPRELNLTTKNLYYCVTCDGPFYKEKDVIVVGSGNTGATFALELASYCKHVYICDLTAKLMCEHTLTERVQATKNITFFPNTSILSTINKYNQLDAVKLNNGNTVKVNAIFSAIGMLPQTQLAEKFIQLDSFNYLGQPNIDGVFAAGDCSAFTKAKQVTTACASGTEAAIAVIQYLNS